MYILGTGVAFLFIGSGLALIAWLAWQLVKAKQFTRFKLYLIKDIKPQVKQSIIEQLHDERSDVFPNNEEHQKATCYYWTQYPVRVLQWALAHNILTEQQLKQEKQWRNCQHLFYVEQAYLVKEQPRVTLPD